MAEEDTYTIVIVDDNDDVRRLLRKVLAAAGHDVIEAIDGNSALEVLKSTVPDLVLMDIKLPGGMSGLDATERIREDERLRGVPVIALTASIMDKDKRQAESAGCSGFIGKPVDVAELPAQVRSFVEQHNVTI